jgi:hypothetical protein
MDTERASSYTQEPTESAAGGLPASPFQANAFMFEQYFDDGCSKTVLEPEKRLMLAILEDAIQCFRNNHSARCGRSKRLFDEVQRWILDARCDWVFSFESICGVLGLDPEYIRKGLVRWRQKELTKRPGAWGSGRDRASAMGKSSPTLVRAF